MLRGLRIRWFLVLFNTAILTLCSVLWDGCAEAPVTQGPSASRAVATGPVILRSSSEPSRIFYRGLQGPVAPQRFVADIRDDFARVTAAELQLANTGIVIPLKHAQDTLWVGSLSEAQIQRLAISGKDAEYEGRVIAWDESGQITRGRDLVRVDIESKSG